MNIIMLGFFPVAKVIRVSLSKFSLKIIPHNARKKINGNILSSVKGSFTFVL